MSARRSAAALDGLHDQVGGPFDRFLRRRLEHLLLLLVGRRRPAARRPRGQQLARLGRLALRLLSHRARSRCFLLSCCVATAAQRLRFSFPVTGASFVEAWPLGGLAPAAVEEGEELGLLAPALGGEERRRVRRGRRLVLERDVDRTVVAAAHQPHYAHLPTNIDKDEDVVSVMVSVTVAGRWSVDLHLSRRIDRIPCRQRCSPGATLGCQHARLAVDRSVPN